MFANITAASRKALDHAAATGCHFLALAETHLNVRKAGRVMRHLQAKGHNTWFSVPRAPVSPAAPPRGGVLIVAGDYL